MSKVPHRTDTGATGGNGKSGPTPYSVAQRRERSRGLAQRRRTAYKSIMDDLTQVSAAWSGFSPEEIVRVAL
jgi:hypothetical protein